MMECLPTIRKLDCSATNMLLLTVCTPKDSDGGDDDIYQSNDLHHSIKLVAILPT